jgi:hypothetical protein
LIQCERKIANAKNEIATANKYNYHKSITKNGQKKTFLKVNLPHNCLPVPS